MIVLGSAAVQTAAADEVIEQIDAGKAYYQEGDLARAMTEFAFALNTLRSRFSRSFMATLPPPPPLWSADTPAQDSGAAIFGTGVMVSRRYLEEKGDGEITAELLVDSPMVQAFSAVFSAPMMIANDPALERVRFGRTTGLLKWDPQKRAGDLSVTLGGRVLAKLVGRNLKEKSVLVDLMRSWDMEVVGEVAGLR